MDIPHFIQDPPSDTEMKTARLLAQGKDIKQTAQLRHLSVDTIRGHTKSLRFKFHVSNIHGVIAFMFLLGYLKPSDLIPLLPVRWQKYLQPKVV